MSKRWLCLAVLLAIGCRGTGSKVASPTITEEACETTEAPCPSDGVAECPAPAKAKCEDIHVHVPRQKVTMPRKSAAATGTRSVLTEQQQIMQTRQVMLVPQQVLVPFVQTTVTGPVRVNGLSETQVVNLAATTTTATAAGGTLTATGQAATGSAAATGAVGGNQAAAGAATPQNLTECLAQLRQSEKHAMDLAARLDQLSREVQRLQSLQTPQVPVPKGQELPKGPDSMPISRVPTPDLPHPRPLPAPGVEPPTIPTVPQPTTNK